MKKAVKKTKKNIKTEVKEKNETLELKKLAYIFGSIIIVFLIFYGIAYLKTSNNKNNQEITSEIQYEKILLSNILKQNKDEYYVLAYNDLENYQNYYYYYIRSYSSKEESLFTYLVDMSDSFNSSYKADESNLDAKDILKIKINEDVLFKISDGKIVFVYEGEDKISDYLKNLK